MTLFVAGDPWGIAPIDRSLSDGLSWSFANRAHWRDVPKPQKRLVMEAAKRMEGSWFPPMDEGVTDCSATR